MRTALLATLASAVLVVGPLAASAAADEPSDDERVVSYVADLTVGGDGSLGVREEITYDFGDDGHHGLRRFIPVRAPYDQTHDRSYPVRDLRVSSPTGAPDEVETETDGGFLDVRVGDPDSEDVRGEQTYVLTYTVPAVVNTLRDGSLQIAYDAVGTGWQVPIDRVDVTVTTPAAVTDPRCFQGEEGSADRCSAQPTATGAVFSAQGLDDEEGVTVAAGLPAGSLTPAAPLLLDTFSPARAFGASTTSLAGVGAVLVAGAAGLLAFRRRREEPQTDPVQVTDVPPGVVGAVVHGGARDVDVVATLLDLAARGHLTIVEHESAQGREVTDWDLYRRDTPDKPTLAEQRLLDTVFAAGPETSLSAVRTTARDGNRRTKELLEDAAVAHGLFHARPAQLVLRWVGLGGTVVAVGAVLTVLLAIWTTHALIGLAVVAVGIAALVAGLAGAGGSPVTARGRQLQARARAFTDTLPRHGGLGAHDGSTPDRFLRLVPYAVALGAGSAWLAGARALQAADAPLPAPAWYTGPAGFGSTFNVALYAGMVGGFSSSTSDALSAAPPATASSSSFSGGGGFTGGAAGGGGGGSW
ncbi:DUF2207 domain-containing protein [Kineococcus sp. SYSU DK003]|uniref:DUF2207 domain-containing protein n=1 Tax=Kineococcus sp. SYSU DK003 TaxID=3383124 RepID=UPI003D7E2848